MPAPDPDSSHQELPQKQKPDPLRTRTALLRQADLAPLVRLGLLVLTWGLIGLAQPGVLRPDGHGHLAFLAIGPWAYAASRPGRRAFLIEWLGHAVGLAGVFHWMIDFMPVILAPMSIVPALYPALAGVLLRRCRRWPLALLAPAAWMLAETLRWLLPVPFSFGWFRLGMLLHDTEWIVGSAAWFGTWGLSWGMAALGGLGADVAYAITRPAGARYPLFGGLVFGLGSLGGLIALSASAASLDPRFKPGPDLLVVQPGISQEIKAARRDPITDRFVPQVTRTLRALYETRDPAAVGDVAQPDLILWGETFLPGKVATPDVREAFDGGARPADWAWPYDRPMDVATLDGRDALARELVDSLFGRSRALDLWRGLFASGVAVDWAERVLAGQPLIPPGTSFLSGVEAWTAVEGEGGEQLRSVNAVAVWNARGEMSTLASKRHIVPGGETGEPLRAFPFVLDAVRSVASAIPDFVATDEPPVLPLVTRSGASYRMGIAVCFDNAFDDPFTGPLRDGPVDFFVVASNEAWYDDSVLMDHMLAFTRIAAASTRRSIVRATNSGISCVVEPDGRVSSLLEVAESGGADGKSGATAENPSGPARRKMVAGSLRARVTVPEAVSDADSWVGGRPGRSAEASPMGPPISFFVRAESWLGHAFGALGLLILVLGILVSRVGSTEGGA